MAETSTQSIVIAAPPQAVTEVICDFARYPEWVSAAKRVEVVEEYEDGYASQVTFAIDASGILQVRARDPATGREQRASLDVVGTLQQEDVAAAREKLQALRR